jgi:hypothetical protein
MTARPAGFWMSHTTPPSGRHCQKRRISARLLASTYVLRSTGSGTMRVHTRLKAGRAITLCCTAKRPRRPRFTSSDVPSGLTGGASMPWGTKLPTNPAA